MTQEAKKQSGLERGALTLTRHLGTPLSLIVHSIFFVGIFGLLLFGVPIDDVMLLLTTAVSLEAIYLSLFIQMSVNKASEDIDEIQEDVEEIEEDIDEIQEDVEEMGEDVEEIQTAQNEEDLEPDHTDTLEGIEANMTKIIREIETLKNDLHHLKK
jgi:predicted transcriptional regulator